jgi:hypothetical protein
MVEKAVSISSFLFRHIVAAAVSIVTPVILWVIAYFLLLMIAIITNTTLGGPLSLPFWALFLLIVSIIYTVALLFPSVLIAEIAARSFGKWQHVAQIPISTLILAVLVFIASLIVRQNPSLAANEYLTWANYPWIVFLCLLIPLGIYWWVMKIVQTGTVLPGWLFKHLRK